MALSSGLLLADKSALEQRRHSERARAYLEAHLAEGTLATCEAVALEVLYSARSRDDYASLERALRAQPWLTVGAEATARALEVQRLLAAKGQHRLPINDLLIAATAEVHGAVVLHYDRDFDRISAVTGQPVRWIVPAGAAG